MPPTARRPLVITALAIATLIAADYGWFHLLKPLERRFGDALTRRVAAQLAPDPDIVIVDIDEASLARMQGAAGRWPWPRAVHAELLAGVLAQKPRAVVFDVLFAEPDVFRPDSDELFRTAVRGQASVYLPTLRLDPSADARGVGARPAFADRRRLNRGARQCSRHGFPGCRRSYFRPLHAVASGDCTRDSRWIR